MWYIITFFAGILITVVIFEWRTGLITGWIVRKIDSLAEKLKNWLIEKHEN